jgi:hypothetical protein
MAGIARDPVVKAGDDGLVAFEDLGPQRPSMYRRAPVMAGFALNSAASAYTASKTDRTTASA